MKSFITHPTKSIAISLLVGSNCAPAIAQTTPQPPQIDRLSQPTPSVLPALPPPLSPAPSPEIDAPLPTADRIKVLRDEVVGSTVFSDRELATITQPFTGEVTFDRLQTAKNAIEKLYLDRQYLTSGAYIPTGQTLSIDGAIESF